MKAESILAEFKLAGEVTVTVHDATSHYYGGYFHVRLVAAAEIHLTPAMFGSEPAFEQARGLMGDTLRFERALEKMAVPEPEIEAVRGNLLASFCDNLLPYLQRPDFAARFACSEYEKMLKARKTIRGRTT